MELLRKPGMNPAGAGPPATPSPRSKYLFRLTSVGALRNYRGLSCSLASIGASDDAKAFDAIRGSSPVPNWAPLSRFYTGHLSNLQEISWWTEHEPTDADIERYARDAGLQRIYAYPLVLRVPEMCLDAISVAIPNSIDAYLSPIFLPVRLPPRKRKHGFTISLNNLSRLRKKHSEFVLGPIDAIHIEVRGSDYADFRTGRDLVPDTPSLWHALTHFSYRS